jgi:SMC interacting uncharacterized protein involved in chromosome segregation
MFTKTGTQLLGNAVDLFVKAKDQAQAALDQLAVEAADNESKIMELEAKRTTLNAQVDKGARFLAKISEFVA